MSIRLNGPVVVTFPPRCVLCAYYGIHRFARSQSVGIGAVCVPCKIATLDAAEALHGTPEMAMRPMANVERKNSRRKK